MDSSDLINIMKVSIITATWNSESTLTDTLESVLSQTYNDIEHIIVDGKSTDSTMSIIKSYESRYKGNLRYISEPDHGIYDAMNKGIAMATGDIVGILNSDDMYNDSSVVSDIVAGFSDAGTGAVCGNLYFVSQNDPTSVVRIWKGSPYKSFKSGWHPAHPTFYAKKQFFEKYGCFDISYDVSADFELMLRFIEKYHVKIKYIDRYFVKMRVGGESTGSLKNIIKGNKNIMRAFKKNGVSVSIFYPIFRLVPKVWSIVKMKFHK